MALVERLESRVLLDFGPMQFDNGRASGMAADSTGAVHLAWYDASTHRLRYATRSATGDWGAPSNIDTNGDVGSFLSLAVDPSDHPAVAYYDATNGNLKYAHHNGVTWDTEIVDSAGNVGLHPSLAFDPDGGPAISFYDATNGDLRVTTFLNGVWRIDAVATEGDVGRFSSIARNPFLQKWGVAFENTTAGTLEFVQWHRGYWARDTVDNTAVAYVSLVYQDNGRPGVAYYDASRGDLRYTQYTGWYQHWLPDTIASKGTLGLYTRAWMDSTNRVHILYYSKSADRVMEASLNTHPKLSHLIRTTVLSAGSGGRWLSAAVAPDGRVTYAWSQEDTLRVDDL